MCCTNIGLGSNLRRCLVYFVAGFSFFVIENVIGRSRRRVSVEQQCLKKMWLADDWSRPDQIERDHWLILK